MKYARYSYMPTFRFGSVPACRGQGWIFNLATCYARPNGRVPPNAIAVMYVGLRVFDSYR